MDELPQELQDLKNIIEDAQANVSVGVLRTIIKSAADTAPAADVIRLAQTILQCGIDIEHSRWPERN